MRYLPFLERWQMPETDYERVLSTHTPVGTHPTTKDILLIADRDLFGGMHILGGPGNGKSYLLENIAVHNMNRGISTFLIDPHIDMVYRAIGRLTKEAVARTFILDIQDIKHPFGLPMNDPEYLFHAFEVFWPDVMGQYLPTYLRACFAILAANPGMTLLNIPKLLSSQELRAEKLAAVTDNSIVDFWKDHDALSRGEQAQRTASLMNRLNILFMGRPMLRGVLGQKEVPFDVRRSILNHENILVPLPLKTHKQDAQVFGTLMLGLLHSTTFSFENMPEHERPGFSVFVDEAPLFMSPDFAELLSEGRKYGLRLCLSHQAMEQLTPKLRAAVENAQNKICFRLNYDDGAHMGHYFIHGQSQVKPEDMDDHPVERLLHMDIPDENAQAFIDIYVRNYKVNKEGNVVIIRQGKSPFDPPKLFTDDPIPSLDYLLLLAMKHANHMLPIPEEVVLGLSNGGRGFYGAWRRIWRKRAWLEDKIDFPDHLVIGTGLQARWSREPESDKEEMLRFFFLLRQTMLYVSLHPLGKISHMTPSEAAHMLTSLPKRAAWIRSGDTVGVIYTETADDAVDTQVLHQRLSIIREQTRAKYCQPVSQADNTPPESDDEPPVSRWEEDE